VGESQPGNKGRGSPAARACSQEHIALACSGFPVLCSSPLCLAVGIFRICSGVKGIVKYLFMIRHDTIRYSLLTPIGLTPGGSSTVHIYTQTVGGNETEYTEQNIYNNKNT